VTELCGQRERTMAIRRVRLRKQFAKVFKVPMRRQQVESAKHRGEAIVHRGKLAVPMAAGIALSG